MSELRLLPLLSSATEIVHALGLGEFQVGRSHECDFPLCVLNLPACTRPVISVDGSSAEIDSLVKQQLQNDLSVYQVDAALIEELHPTHIITQTQCKVCAVSLDDVEIAGTSAKVISLQPFALKDLWSDIQRVATGCGHPALAQPLINTLQSRMASLTAHKPAYRPRVAAIEWLNPLMAAGNWVPELIEMAGGENLFGTVGQHSPWMTWEQLAQSNPDVIVVLPCGFDLARTKYEMHWLTARPECENLKAMQRNQVYICDGNQYMNRPGPRLVESLQIFLEIFHSAAYPPTMRDSAWSVFTKCV